ncbi:MAG: FliH/SctL family protein [Gammaproteobacteria bacterium]|nr:FliH/SctL family protein [Gammaproteobacteria bacterium]
MSNSDDAQVKHWVMPEVTGHIAGGKYPVTGPQTVEDIEALQKQAWEEGRKEGYDAGMDQIKQKGEQLLGMFRFMQQPLDELDETVVAQLTEMTLTVIRLLLKKECTIDAEHIQGVIQQALEYLPVKSREIAVRLNPADIELLQAGGVDLDKEQASYIADASVTQGGCRVESDQSQIDATLETRIQQIVDQLTEQRPQYDEES